MKFRPYNSILAKRRDDLALNNDQNPPHVYEIIGLRPTDELTIGTLVAAARCYWLDDDEKIVTLSRDSIVAIIVPEPNP